MSKSIKTNKIGKIVEFILGSYDGITFTKKTLYFNNKYYLAKSHEKNYKKFKDDKDETITSYNNSIISEHISSKIINLIAMDNDTKAHDTYLIEYKGRNYVACEHYTLNKSGTNVVIKINDLISDYFIDHNIEGNRFIASELENILNTILHQKYIDKGRLLRRFWNQFALDALLLNWDRHGGNWAIINDKNLNKYELSPIFDQGSTLMSKLDSGALSFDSKFGFNSSQKAFVINVDDMEYTNDEEYKNVIERIKKGIFETSSAIRIGGRRINYYDFVKTTDNEDFFKAIKLLIDKIDLSKIFKLIEEELSFSKKYQDFYKLLISLSYNDIILDGLNQNKNYQKWFLKDEK